MPDRAAMAEWPTWKKLVLMGGVVFGILALTLGAVAIRSYARARAATPLETPILVTTFAPTPTPTATPSPSPTPVPSSPALKPTPSLPTPQPGTPPDDPAAPISVEVGGSPPIPVYQAEIDKDGRWVLPSNGAQWLAKSYIRKVFAFGPDIAGSLAFQEGDLVRVRTRGGYVERYVITRHLTVPATQIELMYGQRPSVIMVLASSGETREVWLAEMPEALAYARGTTTTTTNSTQSGTLTALVTVEGARLRAAPSTEARILRYLESGLMLELDMQTIQNGRYTWYQVVRPYKGWVADVVIKILPSP